MRMRVAHKGNIFVPRLENITLKVPLSYFLEKNI